MSKNNPQAEADSKRLAGLSETHHQGIVIGTIEGSCRILAAVHHGRDHLSAVLAAEETELRRRYGDLRIDAAMRSYGFAPVERNDDLAATERNDGFIPATPDPPDDDIPFD